MLEFNINLSVRVQLTEYGKEIHKKQHDEFNKNYITKPLTYHPPREDEDGWSEWQMHTLMNTFGAKLGLCSTLPFKTNIRFKSKDLNDLDA